MRSIALVFCMCRGKVLLKRGAPHSWSLTLSLICAHLWGELFLARDVWPSLLWRFGFEQLSVYPYAMCSIWQCVDKDHITKSWMWALPLNLRLFLLLPLLVLTPCSHPCLCNFQHVCISRWCSQAHWHSLHSSLMILYSVCFVFRTNYFHHVAQPCCQTLLKLLTCTNFWHVGSLWAMCVCSTFFQFFLNPIAADMS